MTLPCLAWTLASPRQLQLSRLMASLLSMPCCHRLGQQYSLQQMLHLRSVCDHKSLAGCVCFCSFTNQQLQRAVYIDLVSKVMSELNVTFLL